MPELSQEDKDLIKQSVESCLDRKDFVRLYGKPCTCCCFNSGGSSRVGAPLMDRHHHWANGQTFIEHHKAGSRPEALEYLEVLYTVRLLSWSDV